MIIQHPYPHQQYQEAQVLGPAPWPGDPTELEGPSPGMPRPALGQPSSIIQPSQQDQLEAAAQKPLSSMSHQELIQALLEAKELAATLQLKLDCYHNYVETLRRQLSFGPMPAPAPGAGAASEPAQVAATTKPAASSRKPRTSNLVFGSAPAIAPPPVPARPSAGAGSNDKTLKYKPAGTKLLTFKNRQGRGY